MKISDADMVKFEQTHIIIQSEFEDTFYAIPRKGGGIIVVSNGKEIPILNENVEAFCHELYEVWKLHKIEKEKRVRKHD